MGRWPTVSGRIIFGTAPHCTRWSLSMVPLLGQLLRPSGTVTIHAGDRGYIFRVIRRPSPTRPETTSRGPTAVRPNELDHPNRPTPWHHHGAHTWWRSPPPRPLVRRRKRPGQRPREVPEVLSDSRRAGRYRRAQAAAVATSPERTRQRASGPRERCRLITEPVVRAANRRHGSPSA